MGNSELSASDLDIYGTFLNSVLYLPNPNENLDRTLPTSLAGGNPVAGEQDYMTVKGTGYGRTCNSCHTANPGLGTNRLILPGFAPQPMDTPQLRNVYQRQLYTRHNATSIDGFGMEHDGNISAPADLLSESIFNGYTAQQKTDMTSYLLCFDTGTAPGVGFTITLTAANVNSQQEQTDWATLQSQAEAANIDLIGRGTIQGEVHGLLYEPASSVYLSDNHVQYTQAQLQSFILNGDTLSFMGVYPGTGTP
jgi:hypothetical protein